jgi:hypothetical protein
MVLVIFTLTGLALTSCAPTNDDNDGPSFPAAGDFIESGLSHIYDGSPKTVSITHKPGKSEGRITVYYEGTGHPKSTDGPINRGEYAVTFDVAAAVGWNAATVQNAGTLIVTASSKKMTFTSVSAFLTWLKQQPLNERKWYDPRTSSR